jgi:hypothetical protein
MNLRKLFEKKIEEIPIAHEEQRGEKSYVLLPPRVIREKNLSDGNEFTYEIRAFSKYFDEIDTMRDYLIRVGTQVGEEIEINNFETYLHAVSHSISRVRGKHLYELRIKFIFRVFVPEIPLGGE